MFVRRSTIAEDDGDNRFGESVSMPGFDVETDGCDTHTVDIVLHRKKGSPHNSAIDVEFCISIAQIEDLYDFIQQFKAERKIE